MIWRDVEKTGCDPSGSLANTCPQSGPDVFGAMLGVAFAAQGLSQCGNFFATFTAARVACYSALQAINRTVGAPEQIIYEESAKEEDEKRADVEEGGQDKELKAILPKYTIDSSSLGGLKPTTAKGAISFKGVHFYYPTRPNAPVLENFNLEIEAGKTVALVGPRYVRALAWRMLGRASSDSTPYFRGLQWRRQIHNGGFDRTFLRPSSGKHILGWN